jgi:hypothetical protein
MFEYIFHLLGQVFLFLLGGVCAVAILLYYINFYLALGEEKTAEVYAKVVAESIDAREKAAAEKKDTSPSVCLKCTLAYNLLEFKYTKDLAQNSYETWR